MLYPKVFRNSRLPRNRCTDRVKDSDENGLTFFFLSFFYKYYILYLGRKLGPYAVTNYL